MKQISDLLKDVKIPKMYKIRELYDATNIPAEDVPGIVTAELGRELIAEKIKPGMRIAITCGSRGIHHYPIFAKAIVDFVKSRGAEPFIVAAMGSHGGATSEGQREILASNGITEEAMGCPVRTEMDSVEVGRSKISGGPVVCDKNAAEADGIILFNRIKPHTSFRGRYESGMLKMMAIGLGKQVGAENIHHQSPAIMGDLIEEYGRTILEATPVIGGIAIIENAYDETFLIRGLAREEILEEEPKLRDLSYEKFGHLLFDETDVLIVDRIGKNISGDGMDPNVTGRFCTPKYCSGGIDAEKIVILDLTDETHGNAQGMGLADITCQRLFKKMKWDMTYMTPLTNTFLHEAKLPVLMDNDKEAIQLALITCPEAEDQNNPKVIRVLDTAHLDVIEISEALLPQAEANPNIEILEGPYEWEFNEEGNLF